MTAYVKNPTWHSGGAPGIDYAALNNLETQFDDAVATVTANVANGANMPHGAIIMWSGLIANIPSGWVICNGNNGTPNLLGRFIEGVATAGTNPGSTGGATAKTTDGHLHTQPTHTHAQQGYGWNAMVNGNSPQLATMDWPTSASGGDNVSTQTDSISDIRPLYYDLAFIMKT